MSADTRLAAAAAREIVERHAFFAAWFRGDAVAAYGDWEAAFAADFRRIGPDGRVHDRPGTIAAIRGAHRSRAADFAIDILDVRTIWSSDDVVLLIYVERQYRDGDRTDRRSTALFVRDGRAPHGVCWRHLQETWVQAPGRP
jgi:hypothetical protein